jgi:hypothetical protein
MEIDLLKKRKTPHDLLLDLERRFVIKKQNKKTGKYVRTNLRDLSGLLGVDSRRLTKYINFGIPKQEKELIKLINDLATIEGIKKFKTWSYQFDRNTFTPQTFYKLFKNVRNVKVSNKDQVLGRAGLYMVFNNNYIIPNYIVSSYDKKEMKKCLKKLGVNINQELKRFPSLMYFYFTFLSLKKVLVKSL